MSTTTVTAYDCVTNGYARELNCPAASASVLSTSTTITLLKEDIQQVEADGYAFIAGEEMSLALEAVIEKARQDDDKLNELSDIEVTTILLQTLK